MTTVRGPLAARIICSGAYLAMLTAVSLIASRFASAGAAKRYVAIAIIAAVHLAAFAVTVWSETNYWSQTGFVLTWGLLNFAWLAVLRRPSLAAALSLPRRALALAAGERSRDKRIIVTGLAPAELASRVSAILGALSSA